MKNILFVLVMMMVACNSETINPVLVDDQTVPDLKSLIQQGKFEYAQDVAGGNWNYEFLKPNSIRTDDLQLVEVGAEMIPSEIVAKVNEMGYRVASPHETVIFATINPDVQRTLMYEFVNANANMSGQVAWIRFTVTPKGGRAVETIVLPGITKIHRTVWTVVHTAK